MALLSCVSLLLRQRKVVLCCCETIFLILRSHLPDNYLANSFDTWLCLHPFRSEKLFELLMNVYTPILHILHSSLQSLWQSTHAWAFVESARNILNDVHTTTLGSLTLTFASNRDCRMVFKNKFSRLLETEISCVQTSRVLRSKEQFYRSHVCKNSNCM